MSKPSVLFRTNRAALEVGKAPRVVGTLSLLAARCAFPCDIVEMRLDKVSRPSGWLERCAAIQSAGKPVLLTVRLRAEGGEWETEDPRRLNIYKEALRSLAAVDVELSSVICREVAREAAKLRKACVVSFHDFEKTPPLAELCAIAAKAQDIGSVVKISTLIRRQSDVALLRALLCRPWSAPLCVIGMGRDGADTRVLFATLGSCLTYGYLDKPAAPGQLSAAELIRRLRPGSSS